MVRKVPGKPYYECEFCHAHLDPGEQCGCDRSVYILNGLQDMNDRMKQLDLIYGPSVIAALKLAIEKKDINSIYHNARILEGVAYTLSELQIFSNTETKDWRRVLDGIQRGDLG
jgi:hypothetical protein